MSQARTILCVAFLVAHAGPTYAEPARTEDLGLIKACLERSDSRATRQEASEACVSLVARRCFGGDEGRAAPAKIIACFDRERSSWEEIMEDSDQSMMARLDETQQISLREMQRSWRHARDLSCTFWLQYSDGPMAYAMAASCTNREVARRAIYLRIFATDRADRKTRAVKSAY